MRPFDLRSFLRPSRPGSGAVLSVPLIRTPQPRLQEMDREEKFADTMEQSRGNTCQVIIQGGIDSPEGPDGKEWYDVEVYYTGPWSRDLPVPDITEAAAVVKVEGLRYARHVVRANI
jgi:hypothetical protein